ncbi:unnamed protein product [Rotaria socialis]|uniref:Uncharacterized protein n=2 Tax=Rotaria socialis TaxID=392032 RepID=A0A817VRV0_9BILA|nr:unnamed protein product [Rotaria socialis]CAF4532147.1 unnamed protein product [Rotaria socialis]CAF4853721.1 unnamed protein product [Rotaria socialis]
MILKFSPGFGIFPIVTQIAADEHELLSSERGFVAILYSGTARSFSAVFQSHIVNLFASCPYTVHIFFHLYKNEWRGGNKTDEDFFRSSFSVNSTIDYYDSYINLDGQRVKIWSMVKGYMFESSSDPESLYKHQWTLLENKKKMLIPIGGDSYQSSILLAMLHSGKASNGMKRTYEKLYSIKYRWVFRMRCDVLLRTNIWEDVFHVQPFVQDNQLHQQALGQYLDWRQRIKSSRWNRIQSQILSFYENYDVFDLKPIQNETHLPIFYFEEFVFVARLNPSSALYTPGCDENGGVNDQFGFSSSLVMDHYHARVSINDMKHMLKDEMRLGFVWGAETTLYLKMKQISLPVIKIENCWSVVRIRSTKPFSERSHLFSSSNHDYCHYADFHGRTCCDSSCAKWFSKWDAMHSNINQFLNRNSPFYEPPLNFSQLNKSLVYHLQMQHHELENRRTVNLGHHFADLEDYYEQLSGSYAIQLKERTFNRAPIFSQKDAVRWSNHYFLHMYGRLLNRITCFNSDFANGYSEQTEKSLSLINPYNDKFLPFIQTTTSQLKQCLFRKRQTCQQNNVPH